MIYLPSWYGFKLDQWRCFLEVFINEHAILLSALNADISQTFSLSHPLVPAEIIQYFGDCWRRFDSWQRMPGCPLGPCKSVYGRFWDRHPPSEHHQRLKPTGSPGEGWLFYLWKADVPFTHQTESLLQKTAVIGCNSRQAGLLVVYVTLWKWNMRDHYPCSFKSWKCSFRGVDVFLSFLIIVLRTN